LIDTYYEYIFKCKTGKYTRKEYERYNENAKDMPTLPPLKNSKKNKRKRKKVNYLVNTLCHKSSLILQNSVAIKVLQQVNSMLQVKIL